MKTKESIKESLKELITAISDKDYKSAREYFNIALNNKKESIIKNKISAGVSLQKESVQNKNLDEQSRTLDWKDGTKIEIDSFGVPKGYKLFQKVDPGQPDYKKPPTNFGKGYIVSRPSRGEGYEITAYPKVKQYEMIYTA